MAMATALLILLLASPAVHAVQYTVGDSAGWTDTVSYTSWVAGKTFTVGDTLLFNYDSSHKVDIVSQSDYNNCVSSNALKSYSDGSTTITISTAGSMYFICPTIGHCANGMKLAVTAVASGTAPTGTPVTPSPPGTPSTTPSTGTSSPPPPPPTHSGAATIIVNMNNLMLGSLLALGAIVAFMG